MCSFFFIFHKNKHNAQEGEVGGKGICRILCTQRSKNMSIDERTGKKKKSD